MEAVSGNLVDVSAGDGCEWFRSRRCCGLALHCPAARSVTVLGDLLVLAGLYFVFRVFRENTFTSATIEVARDQKVISTGPTNPSTISGDISAHRSWDASAQTIGPCGSNKVKPPSTCRAGKKARHCIESMAAILADARQFGSEDLIPGPRSR